MPVSMYEADPVSQQQGLCWKVGYITALTLVARVGEFSHCHNLVQLTVFAGVLPREHSSRV